MTRQLRAFLLAGCFAVAVLQFPAALRSAGEGWNGPYVEVSVPLMAERAADSEPEKLATASDLTAPAESAPAASAPIGIEGALDATRGFAPALLEGAGM